MRPFSRFIHNGQYGDINREPSPPHICKPIYAPTSVNHFNSVDLRLISF